MPLSFNCNVSSSSDTSDIKYIGTLETKGHILYHVFKDRLASILKKIIKLPINDCPPEVQNDRMATCVAGGFLLMMEWCPGSRLTIQDGGNCLSKASVTASHHLCPSPVPSFVNREIWRQPVPVRQAVAVERNQQHVVSAVMQRRRSITAWSTAEWRRPDLMETYL